MTKQNIFLWLLFAAFTVVTFIYPFSSIPILLFASLVVLLGSIFAIVHGVLRYGARGMLVFISSCFVISNILENLSIQTGFPFGNYHYSQALGPKLFEVPLLIGPAYFSTGYLAWTVGNVLLDKIDSKLNKFTVFALPVIASFVMVMWDVVMDPSSSTIKHSWVWHNGGGFFGVPLSNYLGWFFTVYLFFQVFSLYLLKHRPVIKINLPKSYWYQAVLFYLVIGLSFFVNYYAGMNGKVVDATGVIWSQKAILESSVIVSLFTMCFVSVLATVRLFGFDHES